MDALLAAVGGLAGLGLSGWAGLVLGTKVRERAAWVYWALNLATVLIGAGVCATGARLELTWMWALGLGVMGGGLTGLKYGRGRTGGARAVLERTIGAGAGGQGDE